MNHATFKASLFMAAGVIDHETGTRDIRRLSGLVRKLPMTSALAMVATAAMAGVPLMNGFLSKEMFFAETVSTAGGSVLEKALPFFATLAGVFSVTYSFRFIRDVFFGPDATDLPREPHEPPRWMRVPIEVLVLMCLLVGIMPTLVVGPILAAGADGMLGSEVPYYSLAVWHGVTLPLLMSIVALLGGVALYFILRRRFDTTREGAPVLRHFDGRRMFDRSLALIGRRAAKLERIFGTRRLQPQLSLIVLFAIIAATLPLWGLGVGGGPLASPPFDIAFALMWAVASFCAVGSAYVAKHHRLAALALMGVAGVVVCFTFVWLSAPDLALTQLLVEIVTTVLLLLGLRWLPPQAENRPKVAPPAVRWRHLRDLLLATGAGGGLALIAYAVMTRPLANSVAQSFIDRAYTEGGGRNVVNVILVDFRGFDTLGEITVLGIVALSVFSLLRRFRPAPESIALPAQQARALAAYGSASSSALSGDRRSDVMYIPGLIMHWLFPLIGAFAFYLLLRGHDRPGGGFAAGIAMAIAFILQYMAAGTRWVEDRLRIMPVAWIALGLLCAAVTGAAAILFDMPFLTTWFSYAHVPLIGKVPLATALIFDIGVFLLVIGATTLMLTALAHQSIRVRRAGPPVERRGKPEH
jgi:multicomponent K+:H+ antiporter subunit A